jgi:uncharacterized membrane protein (UPF0127 family)
MEFEIVTTERAIARGLSGREIIPANYGMLFVFPHHNTCGFWMKGMLASIDIIWLDDDGTIFGVEHEVSPCTFPKMFYPPIPVRLVLETRAGEARANGLSVGAKVVLPESLAL